MEAWRQEEQSWGLVIGLLFSLVLFILFNFSCVLGLQAPRSYIPTAVSLQGHYPEASCLFLGNSLKFQSWPSGYANISRIAEPPSGYTSGSVVRINHHYPHMGVTV